VTSATVTCSAQSVTLGGVIAGLSSGSLGLTDGTDTVTVNAGSTSFSMPTPLAVGSPYTFTVSTQPAGLFCTVTNGTGTVAATGIGNLALICAAQTYTLGGTVTGLDTAGLVLTDGLDRVAVATGAATFSMPTGVPSGSG